MTRAPSRVIAGGAYALAMAAAGVVAAWPIYAGAQFVAMAAAAIAGSLALSAASRVWRWRRGLLALAAAGLFVVVGLTLAVPRPWTDAGAALGAVADLFTGAITGFKDLLTVELPVGGYRNLLVPVLVVLIVGVITTVLLAWRDDRVGTLAAVPALGMPVFGLLFGRTATSVPVRIGPVVIPAPVELAVGAAALVATVAWLTWRSNDERRAALRRAGAVSGVRVSRRRSGFDRRRRALAGGMLAAAVVVAAVVSPAIADGREREVLRSDVGPRLDLSRATTPLAQYRANFEDAAVDDVLFRVDAVEGQLPDRIRMAALTSYDGALYRVAGPDGVRGDGSFTRVPSRLDPGPGERSVVRIRVESPQGIWLPAFGALESIEFAGADAAALTDAFYYNPETRAAVLTAHGGLRAGDAYTLTAAAALPTPLASLSAPGADPDVTVPDSVRSWIESQDAGTDGAALQTLVDRLRERGYLSHSLEEPDGGATWTQTLGDSYTFQPSASGHSLARIDEIFRELLEREDAAAEEGPNASLVAAVGDDEQFAVAAALIAQKLGFPTRVVVGVRLGGADEGVPPCADGVCMRGNVTAWLEVASRDGEWVPVDVTPQHEAGADTEVTSERDPEVPTDVRPEGAEEVVPPDPAQQDVSVPADQEDAGPDLAALWAALGVAGVVLLILAVIIGPLLVIVAAKVLRRRARRQAPGAGSRIVGGWDEYVDAAVDSGLAASTVDTRSELAARFGTPHGPALAGTADRAVFSDGTLPPEESDEFWRIVDEERRRFTQEAGLWRRASAAVSLNSFTRGIAPRLTRARTRAPRRTERRGRRAIGDGPLT